MKLLNTAEAAEALGVSARRVRALIDAGTLAAHQIGREYAIEESALNAVRTYGKAGRPRGKAAAANKAATRAVKATGGTPTSKAKKKGKK